EIAAGGFHSQAGWILFSTVAFAICSIAGRTPWIMRVPRSRVIDEEQSPAAPYLMPFLAILAAAMVARAASAQFEWFYGLRLVAAAGALWMFRDFYRRLDWSFSWFGGAVGAVVFMAWIAMDRGTGASMPKPLADAGAGLRVMWIAIRALTGILIVPLAEEL